MNLHFLFSCIILSFSISVQCQEVSLPLTRKLTWCNSSPAEFRKCVDLENAVVHAHFLRTTEIVPLMSCTFHRGKRECMQAISAGNADVMAVEAGDMYASGRWFGLVPIAIEEYRGVSVKEAAIVVRRLANIASIKDLKNKSVCSPGATSLAGWSIPTGRLMQVALRNQHPSVTIGNKGPISEKEKTGMGHHSVTICRPFCHRIKTDGKLKMA